MNATGAGALAGRECVPLRASTVGSSASSNQFWSAVAIDAPWKELARSCVAQLAPAGRDADLGFLYVTDAVSGHLPELLKYLRENTGVQNWTGSVGLGICTPHRAVFERPGIAMMLAALPADFVSGLSSRFGFRRSRSVRSPDQVLDSAA